MGIVYEYDAAADKWTKKTSMPVPAHHAALAEYRGKIYVFGGFIAHTRSLDRRATRRKLIEHARIQIAIER